MAETNLRTATDYGNMLPGSGKIALQRLLSLKCGRRRLEK